MCRTPRDGVTEQEAESANQTRDLLNRFESLATDAPSGGTIFFPVDGIGAETLHPLTRTQAARATRTIGVLLRVRQPSSATGRSAPSIRRRGRVMTRAARMRAAQRDSDAEDEDDADDADDAARAGVSVEFAHALQGPFGELMAALTRPGTVGEFMELRRRV